MNDNKKSDGTHETMAGTVGKHANDDHDHPTKTSPTGAKMDVTATSSSDRTGEQGALAGGPAPGQGRASAGPGTEADDATQIVADTTAHSPQADAMKGAKNDRDDER